MTMDVRERNRKYTRRKSAEKWDALFPEWRAASAVTGLTEHSIRMLVKTHKAPATSAADFAQWVAARAVRKREMARIKKRRQVALRREHYNAWDRAYRAANRAKKSAQRKATRSTPEHKAKEREWRLRHRSKPIVRLARNLRNRAYKAIVLEQRSHKSDSAKALLGATPKDVRRWLEKKWLPGMSWENYGQWQVDHIIPCAAFNLASPEDQRRCFHYTNLQPLWSADNLLKRDKLTAPFQPSLI